MTKTGVAIKTPMTARDDFDSALQFALTQWQLASKHTLGFWLRGYCMTFATVITSFLGKSASLSCVLASDGNAHHVIVLFQQHVIDARGLSTPESLIANINRSAVASGNMLKANSIIPFTAEYAANFKVCPPSDARCLTRFINTVEMRRVRSNLFL